MKYWGPLPLQLLLSFLSRGQGALPQDVDCVQVHPCTCLLQGSHQVINLAAVGPLTIPLAPDKEPEGYIQFSPCQPFSEPANLTSTECVQVAACVTLRQAGSGDLHHTTYAWPSSVLNTLAHFNCSPVSTMVHVSLLPTHLEVFIQTPCACPDHCRLWSPDPSFLIVISFFVTLGIYLLWGICGLPVIHTNRGNQLIPQDHFGCNPCLSCLGKSEEDKENIPLMALCSGT
ncbi:uncharacterized protein [Notamacropus eugenii]|uniref:uncharacterized protein isoform X2 n=1 Tax=Notamacropus eugenii TaxID=9315 RepID=UPI003B66F055